MERTSKKIFDRLRNIQLATQQKSADPFDIKETLTSKHFSFAEVSRHGFPHEATCIAFDPIQKLLAVGTANGLIRIFGRPGVDIVLKQEDSRASILRIQFLINEGAFVALCADNCIHLWNFRQKRPEIVHSLKFQRETLTTLHLPFQSKWLYLGTDKGNVHVVALETFSLSGYIINWNKAIDLSQTTHPGVVLHLSDCPTDESKLLIGFERGTIALWDLKNRLVEARFQCEQHLKCVAWHFEGKQFICGHSNGSLSTWSLKRPQEPLQYVFPHAKSKGDPASLIHQTSTLAPTVSAPGTASTRWRSGSTGEKFRPITCVEWKQHRTGDESIMFTGGTPLARSSSNKDASPSGDADDNSQSSDRGAALRSRHSVTIIKGKSVAVLEMQHRIDAFVSLCESPYVYDAQEPYALAVLMRGDLALIDLTSPGYPCFENPNPMDIHESPVTCLTYLADCPADLIPALYSVGAKQQRKRGFSEKSWPIKGGECGECPFSYSELIITGHADGSIKFWDSSSINLQVLYKLKTSKLFERRSSLAPNADNVGARSDRSASSSSSDPLAVDLVDFCSESRQLAAAGRSGQVILFKFEKQDVAHEISVIEVGTLPKGEVANDALNYNFAGEVPGTENAMISSLTPTLRRSQLKTQNSVTSLGSDTSLNSEEVKVFLPIKAKGGLVKQSAGFQADVICLTLWRSNHAPEIAVALAFNSAYNLLAYSTENSLIIVDVSQQICILTMATVDLYGKSAASFAYPAMMTSSGETVTRNVIRVDEHGNLSALNSPATSEPKSEANSLHSSLETTVGSNVGQLTRQSAIVAPQSLLAHGQSCNASFATSPPTSKMSAPAPPTAAANLQSPGTSLANQRSSPLAGKSSAFGAKAAQDREPSSTTRSRSSSCASLTQLTGEYVKCFAFLDSIMSKKNECFSGPILWCGTNFGTILALSLRINFEARLEQLVYALPMGINIPSSDSGSLLKLSFMDQSGDLLMAPADSYRDPARNRDKMLKNRVFSKSKAGTTVITPSSPVLGPTGANDFAIGLSQSPPTATAADVPSTSATAGSNQFLIAVYEKSIRIYSLNSTTFNKAVCQVACPGVNNEQSSSSTSSINSFSTAVVVNMQEQQPPVIITLVKPTCHVTIFSLPSLKLLVDLTSFSSTNAEPADLARLCKTVQFSQRGHGIYMCSPSELQKFVVLAETADQLRSGVCWPDLFQATQTPEPPKQNFFKELFVGSSNKSLDREELFGESSGKTSRGIAKHIPGGNTNLDHLRAQSGGTASEIVRARLALNERGEKLGEVEERTAQMLEGSKSYSDHAHELLNKYKKKKWYKL